MKEKVNLTLSEFVIKMDVIKFECTIFPKLDVIDLRKYDKLTFPQKVAYQHSRPPRRKIWLHVCQEAEDKCFGKPCGTQ